MHIRFNRSLRGDYGRAKAGDVKMVTKEVGKALIQRGLAVETEAPPEADDDAPEGGAKPKGKPRGKAPAPEGGANETDPANDQ